MNAYKHLFLDLDGTVLDFSKSERHAFFCAMKQFGISVDECDFTRYRAINRSFWLALERGEVSDQVFRPLRFKQLLCERGLWNWEALNAAYISHLAEKGVAFPGAVELVYALHEKYTICVLTNGAFRSQQGRLTTSGLAPYVDLMLTSEEAGEPKPASKMFFDAMARLGDTTPAHYIMLGDSLSADIAGARGAGIDSIWYAPDGERKQTDPLPTYRAKSYAEVTSLLLGNTIDSVCKPCYT